MNQKGCELLKKVIKNKYHNVSLENEYFDNEKFYYEFKVMEQLSEKDFDSLEKEIKKLDSNI